MQKYQHINLFTFELGKALSIVPYQKSAGHSKSMCGTLCPLF